MKTKLTGIVRSAALLLSFAVANAAAQRVAVITPEPTRQTKEFAEKFAASFGERFKVLDSDMAAAAYAAVRPETPFNMTDTQARAVAAVVGCDTLVLLNSETLRRASLERGEYYEALATAYIVDGRSGQMRLWKLTNFEAATAGAATSGLLDSASAFGRSTAGEYSGLASPVTARPKIEEISADADLPGLKPPIPYKRIKPEYPRTAYLYSVRATVEVEADIDEAGKVTRTSVVRWAGFGLDEAVVDAVRAMNWRPAMRGGKPLPMRVLLRYNFTKVEKE